MSGLVDRNGSLSGLPVLVNYFSLHSFDVIFFGVVHRCLRASPIYNWPVCVDSVQPCQRHPHLVRELLQPRRPGPLQPVSMTSSPSSTRSAVHDRTDAARSATITRDGPCMRQSTRTILGGLGRGPRI